MVVAAVVLNIFSDTIVTYFIKNNIIECRNFLIYNSWIPFVVVLNMVPYLTFMVYDKQKSVTFVFVLSVFINIFINIILSKKFGIYGISTGIYFTELFISISLWMVLIFKFPDFNFFKKEKQTFT
jgi:O-antigen/teichoic acid export membrane protein